MSLSPLFQIPPEILLDCIELLDYKSLLTCRQVCRQLRNLVDEDAACQYTLDLYTAGLEDGPSFSGTLSDRFAALNQYREGWDQLKWRDAQMDVPMKQGGLWELYGGVLAQQTQTKTFEFTRLPGISRGIASNTWSLEKQRYKVRDFGMDPSQDLLVLLEKPGLDGYSHDWVHRAHFLSLEKNPGAPHPLAKGGPVISHAQNFMDPEMSYTIQVSGNLVGILIHTIQAGENEFLVWDWKSGERKLYLTGDEIRAFTFLSDQHVLLCVLDLFPVEDEDVEPTLVVVDIQRSGAGEPENILRLDECIVLHCPPFQDTVGIASFGICADPSPTWRPDEKSSIPFHLARDNRLYVVTLWIQVQNNALPLWVNLFIPSSTFMSVVKSTPKDASGPHSVSWEAWGQEGSRLMISDLPQSHTWVCYVYGTRYIALEPHQKGNEKVWCRVYDFNDLPIRRGQLNVKPENVIEKDSEMVSPRVSAEVVYQTGPITLKSGKIFKDDVTSTLPFRWKSVELDILASERKCAIMCSEDNIIIVNAHTRKYQILTF
ncbi:hypothetical protein DFP72DRAFT_866994 [Ephemerocybe angulata]|uniref:F-box domain-containing protein n=1 Tax=Ephemerocybe angulata TaxID=980116 RepID=A0A8H6IIY5_9AGAR|nr:hypothetical protein DFP72DRAFT_866994 [Tulosesus angulatus]